MRCHAQCHDTRREPFCSFRVTQLYETGAVVYVYFAFGTAGLEDPVCTFEEVEAAAREEVLARGGSLSHHHGVGKCRKRWMRRAVSETGLAALRALKSGLDPNGVFDNGNLL